jgi:dihydroneopterin aldolase
MQGLVKIIDYKIHCVIGSHAYEREEDQEISIDIEMRLNCAECVLTDSIVDTINYNEVVKVCSDLAKSRRYHLLETFCYETVHALMAAFTPFWVNVRVKKKRAIPLAREVIVEMELVKS